MGDWALREGERLPGGLVGCGQPIEEVRLTQRQTADPVEIGQEPDEEQLQSDLALAQVTGLATAPADHVSDLPLHPRSQVEERLGFL